MSFVQSFSNTVTLTTAGDYSGYSTQAYNGQIHEIYVACSKAMGTGENVLITTTSTDQTLLKVVNPSTLGAFYYPRAICHGTTANTLHTSTDGYIVSDLFALADERVKIKVSASSGQDGETVTVDIKIV